MTEEITLRPEIQADFSKVFEVNHKAFGQENEAKLVEALRNNPTALYRNFQSSQ